MPPCFRLLRLLAMPLFRHVYYLIDAIAYATLMLFFFDTAAIFDAAYAAADVLRRFIFRR